VNFVYVMIVMLFCVMGIILALAGMPGALAAWFGFFIVSLLDGFRSAGPLLVGLLLLAALAGETLDFLGGYAGAKKSGASARGVRGALLGGMAGAALLSVVAPGPGTLLGAAAGTFAGALAGELSGGRSLRGSLKSSGGALFGRAAGSALKVLVIMGSGLIAVAAYMGII